MWYLPLSITLELKKIRIELVTDNPILIFTNLGMEVGFGLPPIQEEYSTSQGISKSAK